MDRVYGARLVEDVVEFLRERRCVPGPFARVVDLYLVPGRQRGVETPQPLIRQPHIHAGIVPDRRRAPLQPQDEILELLIDEDQQSESAYRLENSAVPPEEARAEVSPTCWQCLSAAGELKQRAKSRLVRKAVVLPVTASATPRASAMPVGTGFAEPPRVNSDWSAQKAFVTWRNRPEPSVGESNGGSPIHIVPHSW